MSIWVQETLKDLLRRVAALEAKESQAKPTEQPAPPPDLRTREGKAWKNANSSQ